MNTEAIADIVGVILSPPLEEGLAEDPPLSSKETGTFALPSPPLNWSWDRGCWGECVVKSR